MTAKQKRALAALLTASTVQEAATEAKVSYATLRRWLTDDKEFRAEYDAVLRELVEGAAAKARQGMTEAVGVLREIMADDEAAPNARVQAARATIDCGLKIVEISDIINRLEALENAQRD